MNPFTNEPYSDEYKQLAPVWQALPAWQKVDTIKASIKKYPITFIISGTGSGKTVVTPMAAIDVLDYKGKVAITLPKKEITRSVAQFASKTMDAEIGKDIGYVHKGSDKKHLGKEPKLVYMTDGTLIAKLNQDPMLEEFDTVIIDEAHERKAQVDLMLLFLKRILVSGKRKDFRVIVMSATIDTDKYVSYFKGIKSNVINISGTSNYPIDVRYLKEPTPSYVKTGIEIIDTVLGMEGRNDLLFFVTSGNEAKMVCKQITSNKPKVFCIEVFAEMNPAMTIYAKSKDDFLTLGDYDKKLVIGTNMAESSLTIAGLVFVVDSCHALVSKYDPKVYGTILKKELITKAQAVQRRGRVGRTEPGICYHLLTKKQFDELEEYPPPDILKQDLTIILLQMIKMTEGKTLSEGLSMLNELMDKPDKSYVDSAVGLFNMYKLIDDEGYLTKVGADAAVFSSLSLNRILFMIYSYQMHSLREATGIVSLIEKSDGNVKRLFRDDRSNKIKKFINKKSDHLTYMKIFMEFFEAKDRKEWCEKNDLSFGALSFALRQSRQYYGRVKDMMQEKQPERSRSSNTKKSIINALKLSHRHLNKHIGTIDLNSVVDKKAASKKKYVYDSLDNLGGQWKASVVTIV